MTGFARLLSRDLDRRLDAGGRFFERDLEVVAQVRAALRASAPASRSEDVAEPEDVAQAREDVREVGEDGRIETRPGSGPRDAGVTETVVEAPFLAIGQHGVRFGGFLELILRLSIARVSVGMVLEGQFSIRALDLLIRGLALDAQHLVVITLAHAAPHQLNRLARMRREGYITRPSPPSPSMA